MNNALPVLLFQFATTVLLGFVLGLELHSYRRSQQQPLGFGTTRTITLTAAAGFLCWLLGAATAQGRYAFPAGLILLSAWLAVYLAMDLRASTNGSGGTMLPYLVALFAYLLGPLVLTQPGWLVASTLILVIVSLGIKPGIRRFSDRVPVSEGVTFAKFLLLAGLVLPLLPDTPVPGLVDITYAKVWMAVVAISAISYTGYLAHTYAFPKAGVFLTGLLGGIYSSTAATVVLARQARTDPDIARQAPAATLLATAMMYVRLWVVLLVLGHWPAARALLVPFAVLMAGTLAMAVLLWRRARATGGPGVAPAQIGPHNPLELPVAFLFAGLFVFFAALTQYVTGHFGATGLHVLSFLVGFSDIDPFVLSLLAGHFQVSAAAVIAAVLTATGSNNLLKAGYALALSRQRAMLPAAAWLVLTVLVSVAWALW